MPPEWTSSVQEGKTNMLNANRIVIRLPVDRSAIRPISATYAEIEHRGLPVSAVIDQATGDLLLTDSRQPEHQRTAPRLLALAADILNRPHPAASGRATRYEMRILEMHGGHVGAFVWDTRARKGKAPFIMMGEAGTLAALNMKVISAAISVADGLNAIEYRP
jgi:hypothetical protein